MKTAHNIKYFLLILLLLLPFTATAEPARVLSVIDGNTIEVIYKGKPEKVRFLKVNTPESVHLYRKKNMPPRTTAFEYAKKRLSGRYVDLEFEGEFRGRYGRLLAYVYVKGVNFNLELVRQGLSLYYTKYGKSRRYDKEFRAAEKAARDEKRGIWSTPESTQKYLGLESNWGRKAATINE